MKIRLYLILWDSPMRHDIFGYTTKKLLFLLHGLFTVDQELLATRLFGVWLEKIWTMEIWMFVRLKI